MEKNNLLEVRNRKLNKKINTLQTESRNHFLSINNQTQDTCRLMVEINGIPKYKNANFLEVLQVLFEKIKVVT